VTNIKKSNQLASSCTTAPMNFRTFGWLPTFSPVKLILAFISNSSSGVNRSNTIEGYLKLNQDNTYHLENGKHMIIFFDKIKRIQFTVYF
jgi:hypothetical protein